MIIIKTKEEIEKLREGGPILARILKEVAGHVKAGITTASLDVIAHDLISQAGRVPAFLNYKPYGARHPFPASLCVSVNEEVVHGIPGGRILKQGDIVSLDLGLKYKGVFLDHAITVPVGVISKADTELLRTTKESLYEGIAAIVPGATVGDIGNAIQTILQKKKFGIVRGLSGHGVGREIHEDPYVPNYGKKGKGEKLRPGMVIAIEPMVTLGGEDVRELKDGYTLVTTDGSRAAHFEHTVLITETGAEILTE